MSNPEDSNTTPTAGELADTAAKALAAEAAKEAEAAAKAEASKSAQKNRAPKKGPKAKDTETSKEFIWYVSRDRETSAFEVTLSTKEGNKTIRGAWDAAREFVHWKVPAELKEAMDKHHHVWTGRIICAAKDK